MKHTTFLFIALFLAACAGEKHTENTAEQVAAPSPSTVNEEATFETPDLSEVVPDDLYLNGTLVLPPQQFASVTLVMGGTVHSTNLMPGEFVKEGSTLALLENIDFINLQQRYLEASAQTAYLETEYYRQKRLSEQEAASKKRFQESHAEYLSMKSRKEAAEAQLRMLNISPDEIAREGIRPYLAVKAPITGYVTGMKINIGKYFQAGESICDIVDKGEMMLNLTIYEKDLPYLSNGERISFVVNGISGSFDATIFSIGQEVDPASRSLEVYAKTKESHSLFRPGMYVTARVDKK